MKMLNIPQLIQAVQELPEVVYSENPMQLEKYLRLLDLITDDYLSPEHLLVPEEDWQELGEFICSIQVSGEVDLNPHAEMIRQKLRYVTMMHKTEQGFIDTKTLLVLSDDFI